MFNLNWRAFSSKTDLKLSVVKIVHYYWLFPETNQRDTAPNYNPQTNRLAQSHPYFHYLLSFHSSTTIQTLFLVEACLQGWQYYLVNRPSHLHHPRLSLDHHHLNRLHHRTD